MVSGIAKAWHRSGDLRDTSQAHSEVAAELSALGGRAVYPVSEAAVDSMRAEIRRLSPPPVQPDPATREAASEFSTAARRLQQLCFDLAEYQRRLVYLKDSPAHRLLGDITPAMLAAPPDPQTVIIELFGRERLQSYNPAKVFDTPTYETASEYRQATLALQARLGELDNVRARIASVMHFETQSGEERCMALIFAVAAKLDAVRERLERAEGHINQRIGELEHPAPARRGSRRT